MLTKYVRHWRFPVIWKNLFVVISLVSRSGWHEVEGLDTLLGLGGAGTVFVLDIRESEVPTLVEVRRD